MKRPLPWFTMPVAVLTIGVVLAGFVVYRIVTRDDSSDRTVNTNANNNGASGETCGNGVCEDVACLGTNCPAPESSASCPEDCGDQANSNTDGQPTNQNGNTNVNAPAGTLNFSTSPQTLDDKATCPVEDANLSPSDAVAIAARAGLEQGTQSVSVQLALSEPPLEQCVWTVRNFLQPESGRQMLIVDSTQDVYRTSTWGQAGS